MASSDRSGYRTKVRRVEVVTVYRDRRNLPYEDALKALDSLAPLYQMFSVVAVIADVSQQGLGLRIEGQQKMASNMLKPEERYLLKLSLATVEIEQPRPSFLRREGDHHFLLIKSICRWVRTGETTTAGFALSGSNSQEVQDFVREYFGPRRHRGTWS